MTAKPVRSITSTALPNESSALRSRARTCAPHKDTQKHRDESAHAYSRMPALPCALARSCEVISMMYP
eukprot:4009502-Pleurochrysis_carterae.AAC.1